ncbi:hypothetical protein [Nocardioides currus]|uniref:hypothetical protein n=1 Tax=Nocardioides currus TaxID=2133958 RepID=UPI0010572CFC|nr:hypothetical protein [Nocardioides currus]
MNTPALSTPARIAARASLPLVALCLALVAAPAHAEQAEGWTTVEDVDTLHALLLLGGLPVLLFVLIGLAVYVPAIVRGEDVSPGGMAPESLWLGGPRASAKELPAGDSADETDETGGARGSW